MLFRSLAAVVLLLITTTLAHAAPTLNGSVCTLTRPTTDAPLDVTAEYRQCLTWLENRWMYIYRMQIVFQPGYYWLDPAVRSSPADPTARTGFNLCSVYRPVEVVGNGSYISPTPTTSGAPVFLRAETGAECVVSDLHVEVKARAEIGFMAWRAPYRLDHLVVKDATYVGLFVFGNQTADWGSLEVTNSADYMAQLPSARGAIFSKNNALHVNRLKLMQFTNDGLTICGNRDECGGILTPADIQRGDGYPTFDFVQAESHVWDFKPVEERQWFSVIRSSTSNDAYIASLSTESSIRTISLEAGTGGFKVGQGRVIGPGDIPWMRIDWGFHTRVNNMTVSGNPEVTVRTKNFDDTWRSVWNHVEAQRYAWSAHLSLHQWTPLVFQNAIGEEIWRCWRENRGYVAYDMPSPNVLLDEPVVWNVHPSPGAPIGWHWNGTVWEAFRSMPD